jgi:cytochrome P450
MIDSLPESRGPVHDFDFQADPAVLTRGLDGYLDLKRTAPPVFWTPHNGGHWMVTTADAAIAVLRHPEIYSSQYLSIPPNPQQQKMIPESLDPPEHRAYRQLLRPWFESKAIAPLEPKITAWAERLIEAVADKGECAFINDVGSRFPVSVFMEMFGFPLDQLEMFRTLVTDFFKASAHEEDRMRMSGQIVGILVSLITERKAAPRDDMISKLVTSEFEGRELTMEELISIGFLWSAHCHSACGTSLETPSFASG